MGCGPSKSGDGNDSGNNPNNNNTSNSNNSNNNNNNSSNNNNNNNSSENEDSMITTNKANGKKVVKVLLLGSGDTGKSTCFKQMNIIHNEGFDEKIISDYKDAVRASALKAMKSLITACQDFEYPIDENLISAAETLDDLGEEVYLKINKVWNTQIAQHIKTLWTDESIRKAYERNNEFQLIENAKYYFEHIDRISEEGYRPTPVDILSTRTKTVGVVEKNITINDQLEFKLIDVGGQRSERRKWFSLFKGITLVVFLAAASDFNKLCYEDDETNRMIENYTLFKEIVNNPLFAQTPFVILFNKMDIFKEKIQAGQKISAAFSDYDGSQNADEAIDFIKEKYKHARSNFVRVDCFETMATDTEELSKVFDEIKTIIAGLITAYEAKTNQTQ